MLANEKTLAGIAISSVLGVVALIEVTGGLPSQLAHLYYLPVVAGALLLPRRLSLVVALMAGAAVSPLPDLAHWALGRDFYYDDPSPWNLGSSGWIVRPIAFLAINLVASAYRHEQSVRLAVSTLSEARAEELNILGEIDKMVLKGASERASINQIARLVAVLTGAKLAQVVLATDAAGQSVLVAYGSRSDPSAPPLTDQVIPAGEGVSGAAAETRQTSTSRNVFSDARYQRLAEVARRAGYVSAAAAAMVLDGVVIGALMIGYGDEREFTVDELATLERLAAQAAVAIGHARQRKNLEELAHETALALASAIESRDPYTGHHCARLAEYAELVAEHLRLDAATVQAIRLGAALHDIGKVSVPDSILLKPGPLTDEEFDCLKQHCRTGADICRRISLVNGLNDIVEHHHERYDGAGYPDGLAGESIPLGARIVAVVDAYDAMTTDRPYRTRRSHEEAATVLREGAGTQWDPRVVAHFLAALPAQQTSLAA